MIGFLNYNFQSDINYNYMKKLLLLMLLISSQAFCQRDVFFSGNLNYDVGRTQVEKNNYYISESFRRTFSVKPSILWKTKKKRIREIELTNFGLRHNSTFIDSPDSSFSPRNFINNVETNTFNFELTHRYYFNFLKKKSDKFTLGFVVSNSLYMTRGVSIPYHQDDYYRKQFTIGSNFKLSYGASYTIKKRFFVGLRSNFMELFTGYTNNIYNRLEFI
jgi:hypothetical protein